MVCVGRLEGVFDGHGEIAVGDAAEEFGAGGFEHGAEPIGIGIGTLEGSGESGWAGSIEPCEAGGWIGGTPSWEDLINEEAEEFAAEVVEGVLDGSPAIDDAPCVVEGATLGARHDAT